MKITRKVRYWALADQGQGHRVTLNFFAPFTAIQTVRFHNSTLVLVQEMKLIILSMYVYLITIYKVYKYRHA